MARARESLPPLTFHPLEAGRWPDLARLFGERGACGGCWCMWWRLRASDYARQRGAANRVAFRRIVRAGAEPGVLAYARDEAIGWCALAPRDEYPRLEGSRLLAPVDAEPVWSVSCFFVAPGFRRRGLTVRLLRAALAFARERGARIVEGYPVEPARGTTAAAWAWTGLAAAFRRAGFREVARRSPTRPIFRYTLRPSAVRRTPARPAAAKRG